MRYATLSSDRFTGRTPRLRMVPAAWLSSALAPLLAAALPCSPCLGQAPEFSDSLLPRIRALTSTMAGERPLSLNFFKFAELSAPLGVSIDARDTTRVTVAFPVFQIRFRNDWIIVDAGYDRDAMVQYYGPKVPFTYWQDRFDRVQAAMREARRVVLTHEHFDHAAGVERGPYFEQIASRTYLTPEQKRALLQPPNRAFIRLPPDSAADFALLKGDPIEALAPGVVLVRAPGHSPGSQFVYVRLESGREYLLVGDLVWMMAGLERGLQKPTATSQELGEDRAAIQRQLDWVRMVMQHSGIIVLPCHDNARLAALVAQGMLGDSLELARR